jgi:hypothetical protein
MGLREGRFTIRKSHYHSSHRAKGGSLFKLIFLSFNCETRARVIGWIFHGNMIEAQCM